MAFRESLSLAMLQSGLNTLQTAVTGKVTLKGADKGETAELDLMLRLPCTALQKWAKPVWPNGWYDSTTCAQILHRSLIILDNIANSPPDLLCHHLNKCLLKSQPRQPPGLHRERNDSSVPLCAPANPCDSPGLFVIAFTSTQ
jgi:hypothetical protein